MHYNQKCKHHCGIINNRLSKSNIITNEVDAITMSCNKYIEYTDWRKKRCYMDSNVLIRAHVSSLLPSS